MIGNVPATMPDTMMNMPSVLGTGDVRINNCQLLQLNTGFAENKMAAK